MLGLTKKGMTSWRALIVVMLCFAWSGCNACDTEVYVVKGNALIVAGSDLVDFGDVPVNFRISRNLQILNSGQTELTISEIRIESEDTVFEVATPSLRLPAQTDVDLVLSFMPQEEKAYEGTLVLVSDATNVEKMEVRLTGTGLADRVCGECNDPPANYCLTESDLVVYEQEGYCEDDQCLYIAIHIDCPWGCDAETATCFPDCQGEDCPSVDAGSNTDGHTDGAADGTTDGTADGTVDGTIDDTLDGGTLEPQETIDAGIEPEPEVEDAGPPVATPTGEIIDVAVGRHTSCALRNNGKVYCWGSNGGGRLGIGSSDGQPHPSPVQAALLPENDLVTDIQMSSMGAMARLESGQLFCWGACMKATPNTTSLTSQYTPALMAGINDIVYFEMAHWHVCGEKSNGDIVCWGRNANATLGNGNENLDGNYTHNSFGNITHLGTGYYMSGGGHTCALADNDDVWCWGLNKRGQAGQTNGDACTDGDCVKSPQKVDGLENLDLIYLDSSNATNCVVTHLGEVWCWGQNTNGQLGNGNQTHTAVPQQVLGLNGVQIKTVSMGSGHACALSELGKVYCWGSNTYWNQVGDSSDVNQLQAVLVPGLPLPATQVAARTEHTCALLEDKNVWCWGANSKGQSGVMPEDGEICNPPSNYCSIPRRVEFPWE